MGTCSLCDADLVTTLGTIDIFFIFVVTGFRNYENGVTVDQRLRTTGVHYVWSNVMMS